MSKTAYRKDIDGLRAVAVLSVIVFHYFPKILKGGFVGVDIFFVISGFLISSIIFKALDKKEFSFADFYSHRIKRILPALIVVLSACIIIGWFILLPDEYELLGKHIVSSVLFATNLELYQENGYFDAASNSKPLLHLWSLGVEEQYYLLWPVIIILIHRFRIKLLPSILFLSFLSLLLACVENETFAFFMPQTRFWELSIGSLLAYIEIYKRESFDNLLQKIIKINSVKNLQNIKSFIGLLMVFLAIRHKHFNIEGLLLATVGGFLLISSGKDAFINQKILGNKVLVYIGLISYPLYLWHWPLLVMMQLSKQNFSYLDNSLILLLSFLLAVLTYKFIECKIRYRKEKIVPPLLLLIFISIGFAGFLIYKKDGLINRFSKELSPIFYLKSNAQEMRYEKCFLNDKGQDSSSFQEECFEGNYKNKPLIFLWGDSHAAHLYPGLLSLQQANHGFGLAQFNVGSCPPILGNEFAYLGNKFCKKNNDYIFQKIISLKPNLVLLSFSLAAISQSDLDGLEDTIKLLKQEEIKEIILIGTMPLYDIYRGKEKGSFKKLLLQISEKENIIPYRNKTGISDLKQEEEALRAIAERSGARYISMLDLLCNKEGCLLRVDDNSIPQLLTYDGGHLTTAGSEFVIKKISSEIMRNIH